MNNMLEVMIFSYEFVWAFGILGFVLAAVYLVGG